MTRQLGAPARFLDDHVAAVLRDAPCPLSTKEVGALVGKQWFANIRDSVGNVGKWVDIGSFDQDVWRSLRRLTSSGLAETCQPIDPEWRYHAGLRFWQRTDVLHTNHLRTEDLPPLRTTPHR